MKVTLSAEHKAFEKEKKSLFAAHIKGLKFKDKENPCISNTLKFEFDQFNSTQASKISQLYEKNETKKFRLIKEKCKNNYQNINAQENNPKKQESLCSEGKNMKKVNYNPETVDNRIKNSINELKGAKNDEENHSTKANSREKSRANSVESSSNNCCNFIKIQKEEVIVASQNNAGELSIKKEKIKDKKKKISKILSPEITKITRIIMLDWIFQLSAEIELPRQALYNSIDYIDKFVMEREVKKTQYQKIGLACLFLATKLEMSSHPRVQIFLEAMDNQLDKEVLIETERIVVNTLKFRLNPPTLYQFMTVAIMTIKTFKSEYRNIGWVNDIPVIERGNYVYQKMHWILDGVIMEGGLTNKYGKDEICLSILYVSMFLSIKNSKHSSEIIQEKIKSIETIRHESIAFTEHSFSSFDKSVSVQSEECEKFNISYECFIRYVTTSNKSLKDFYNCISDLEKWTNSECSCIDYHSEYHEELKNLALTKE